MERSPGNRWLPSSRLRWAGPSKEDMEAAPVTAATGALGPVITKLAALLGREYKLRWRTRRDVKSIRAKLKPVHSILWNIWEKVELDEASKVLKMDALDLADDVDDAIVDFILRLERSRSNNRLVQTRIEVSPFQDFKKRSSDVSGRCRSKWKKLFSCGKIPTNDSSPGKPRAYPFVHKDISELVGMVEPRDNLIRHLVGEDQTTPVELQLKTAFINGPAGMGKTTLAHLVYEEIGSKFESRAFVSVTPGSNIREVLASVLQQVDPNRSVQLAGTEEAEDLINIISNFLKEKRYLVIIDDVWNWREWEIIMESFPMNDLSSRIVGTTRITSVAEKWRNDSDANISTTTKKSLLHEMLYSWEYGRGWVYGNIATGMVAMKTDLVTEDFGKRKPIMSMCGGMPLAVCCLFSAVAHEREKQAQQGIQANACDVQAEILKHVMENGIQNTPGFEPLVESLELSFDDLPHHMLKTCVLYCSLYPDGHTFKQDNLVRRWISEGFAYTEEEANGYFDEIVKRGLILFVPDNKLRMHTMMRNFLRWKSRQDNFITCSSEITPSYNNVCRIRRLCICKSPRRSRDAVSADPLSALDWNHIRSLVVYEGIKRVPLEKLEGVRVLDLCVESVVDQHLKDICGLVRLRHLLGLSGARISVIPPEIVRLQCLETLQASNIPLPGLIGKLQQLKTLEVSGTAVTELPREIRALQQLQTLRIRSTYISELPKEIEELQQLIILDIGNTRITMLPKDIRKLQQLMILDIGDTPITVLPKEIGKLQHLEHLLMMDTNVEKIPREIGGLKDLKSFEVGKSITVLPLEVCTLVELPDCIHQVLKQSDLLSELAREMLSFQKSSSIGLQGGLFVGAKQMHIPPWIKDHFNDIVVLDIRICKLAEQGLKILREMPGLEELTLRFEVVPKDPVVISDEGFRMLTSLTVDSRMPRVTFQEGAMPNLLFLTFWIQFYVGPLNKDPVGVNHLRELISIEFKCNRNWYPGADSPCIRTMVDVMVKESQELPNLSVFNICGEDGYSDNACVLSFVAFIDLYGPRSMALPHNTKFYRLGNGGNMMFVKDIDDLSEHLGRPHPEFLGTQMDNQPGRELQWVITADLRGKREPPISMRIHFSVMESNWLDGLARAMQEALARLCGQHVTELYGTRFAHLAMHDSIGGPRALSPHPELKNHVEHLDVMLHDTEKELGNYRVYANQIRSHLAR
nr:disease resistance protein PIK5-NP-like [Lolium perenne]